MIITVERHEQREKENEEKSKWIFSILDRLGIPTSDWKIDGADQMMPTLRKIRRQLQTFDLEIVDNCNCGIDIYFKGQLLAKWERPQYILKEKKQERDPKFRYYLEMHLNIKEYFK